MTTGERPRWLLPTTTAPQTLRRMASLVRDAVVDPITWQTAQSIVCDVAERDQVGQVAALRAWAKAHMRFIDDPAGVELVPDPRAELQRIAAHGYWQGDCDDAAVLTAALCQAIGVPVELIAAGYDKDGPYQHVYAVAYPRASAGDMQRVPVELDTTRPDWVPDLPTFAKRLHLWIS